MKENLYPSNIYCIACGSIIDNSRAYALCDSCIEKLHWIEDRTCDKCGKLIESEHWRSLCYDCMEHKRYFDKGYTCTQYGLYERIIIKELKYKGKAYIGKKIGEILYDRIKIEDIIIDFIIPVPIHRSREKQRGYNQAEIIAKALGQKIKKPVRKKIIARSKETKPMKGLSMEERVENISNAFSIISERKNIIKGKKILVVDDIYTTGSTVDFISKILKGEGASKVYILTFAAGGNLVPNYDI